MRDIVAEQLEHCQKELDYLQRENAALKEESNELIRIYEAEKKTCHKLQLELEQIKQEHSWIPCEERLPEPPKGKPLETYLVTDGEYRYLAYYDWTVNKWLLSECTDAREPIAWTEIIAWQPLPEAYKKA